jgi:hypothetical protein
MNEDSPASLRPLFAPNTILVSVIDENNDAYDLDIKPNNSSPMDRTESRCATVVCW